jgi:branched-chain amino acid transport system permease protein
MPTHVLIARAALPFLVSLLLALLLHFGVARFLDDYDRGLVMSVGINIMLAVSLTMVNGFTGQFSIGHAGFLGVGGYVAGAVTYATSLKLYGDLETRGSMLSGTSLNVDPATLSWFGQGDLLFVASLLAGGCAAALIGYVVGLPSLRLRGDYLAIVTLGFGEIVRVLIQRTDKTAALQAWDRVHPGVPAPEGVSRVFAIENSVLDPATGLSQTTYTAVSDANWFEIAPRVGGSLGFSAVPDYTSIFWVVLFAGVTIAVASRIKRSTFGRAFLSIREDEIASEAMGVDTVRYKVRAFVIAAFFAGLAGGLFAHFKSMNPNEIGFARSFDIVIMVVLGGLGSISGASIAAIIVTLLPEWLRGLDQYRMIIWALALILMMIFRPQGLLGVREIWDKALWQGLVRFMKREKSSPKAGGGA